MEIVEGNPVILHCNISPSSYSEFVHVIAWKTVDQFGYQTQILSDGTRYVKASSIIPSLSLHELNPTGLTKYEPFLDNNVQIRLCRYVDKRKENKRLDSAALSKGLSRQRRFAW